MLWICITTNTVINALRKPWRMNWYIQVSKTIDYQLTKLEIWKWDSFKFMICQNCIYYLQITEVRHIHERFLSGEALFKQKKGFSAPEKNVFESRNLQRYDKCLKKKNLCHKKFSLAGMTGVDSGHCTLFLTLSLIFLFYHEYTISKILAIILRYFFIMDLKNQ